MYRITSLLVLCLFFVLSACRQSNPVEADSEVSAKEDVEMTSAPKTEADDLSKGIAEKNGKVSDEKPITSTGKTVPKPPPAPTASVSIPKSSSKSKNTGNTSDHSNKDQKIAAGAKIEKSSSANREDKSSLEKISSSATGVDLNKAPSFNKPDHGNWSSQLSQYVSAKGRVDYAAWKRTEGELDSYLEELSDHPPTSDWSRNEQMAYWINAYNAFTVKLILKNYPVQKITDLHAGKPWDVRWIKLNNKSYSLNQIENDILRPRYGDARIHFAVNCAAVSCPPLMNKAYTAGNLSSSLATNARAFINNSTFNSLGSSSAEISKIFEWYKSDFGDLAAYLNKYGKTKLDADATISFKEYNWSLNGK